MARDVVVGVLGRVARPSDVKILAVSPYLPYEGIPHAGGAFLLRHLEELHRRNDVTLMVGTFDDPVRARVPAPSWLDVVPAVPAPDVRPDLAQQRDRVRRRLRYRCINASVMRALRDGGLFERAAAADVVELHWTESALLARDLRRAGISTPIVVVAYDIDAEAVLSHDRQVGSSRAQLRSHVLRRVWSRAARSDLNAADLILIFKRGDSDLLRRLGVRTPTQVLAPNLDFPDGPPPERRRPVLLFTGAMWRSENEHGVAWFLDNVWPSVRAAVRDASFTVAGAGPSISLQELVDQREGVTLTGEVPSLVPYYLDASAFVAPLFVAGGLKFKVAQAMAFGLPVVATTIAAQGIVDAAPPGTLWAVTDDPAPMAAALVALFRSPEQAVSTGEAAARWSREHYSFERSTADLLESYAALRRS